MNQHNLPETHPFVVTLHDDGSTHRLQKAFAWLSENQVDYEYSVFRRDIIFGFRDEARAIEFKLVL